MISKAPDFAKQYPVLGDLCAAGIIHKMEFVKYYGSASLAGEYYQKAASLSRDREFAAKALYCAKIAAEKYKAHF